MYALIETNGANIIAINIDKDNAMDALPALARMLESNAVFINKGYKDIETVKPKMSIILDNVYQLENYDQEIAVSGDGSCIGPEFVIATPSVFASNAKGLMKKNDEISRLKQELSYVKTQLSDTKEKLMKMIGEED